MALEVPLGLQAAVGDPEIDYTGQQSRVQYDIMSFLSGVTLKNDLKVSQRGAGANMSVDVAAGSAMIAGGTVSYQGKYPVRSTAVVNVPVGAPPGTGTRTDLIVAQVYDNQVDASGLYSWAPICVPGTTTAPPSSIPLARITVAAGVGSIVTSAIKDVRLLSTLGDVPKWQLTGGNGQAIPNATDTTYTGWNFSDLVGVDTNSNPGEMVMRQAGRVMVHHTARISLGGNVQTEKAVFVEHLRGGSVIRRPASQSQVPFAVGSAGLPLTATGTAYVQSGDVLRARVYQSSGVQLNLTDAFTECTFSGVWVGP